MVALVNENQFHQDRLPVPVLNQQEDQPVEINRSQVAINRWKILSRKNITDLALKVVALVAIALACAAGYFGGLYLAAPIAGTLMAILPGSLSILSAAGAGATFLIAKFRLDFTKYYKANIAFDISLKIYQQSLGAFKFNYAEKLNKLVRYGFIQQEAATQIQDIFRRKDILDSYIKVNASKWRGINVNQFPQESGVHAAYREYRAKENELRDLEAEYIDLRDQSIMPNLPFPNGN